jgi:hypothetical protein
MIIKILYFTIIIKFYPSHKNKFFWARKLYYNFYEKNLLRINVLFNFSTQKNIPYYIRVS